MDFLEQIQRFSFFDNMNIDNIRDGLTGVLRREHIISLCNDLIAKKNPFSMMILDIDNFKLINDNYGHSIGDEVLNTMAGKLIESVGENGIVGRYGGDEFIIVSTKVYEYDDVWKFIKKIYTEVFRYNVLDSNVVEFFLSCTTGSVSFPRDATNYKTLFQKADKALYRGKQKGRNCFIIYVEEKHKNIDTTLSRSRVPVNEIMDNVYDLFFAKGDFEQNIKLAFIYVCNFYSLSNIHLTKDGKVVYSFTRTGVMKPLLDTFIEPLFKDNKMVVFSDFSVIQHKEIHKYCFENNIKSFVCAKVYVESDIFGTLILQDTNIKRIWQKNEVAFFSYLAKILGLILKIRRVSTI